MALTKSHNRIIAGSVINVVDYGAIGNGIADDTAAIQAAYNAASSSSAISKNVFFPYGVYRITSSIILVDSNYSYFIGEGGHYTGSKILVDFDGPGFYGPAGYNSTNSFANLVMQKSSAATYPNSYGVYIEGGAVENTFRECSFLEFGQVGLKINNAFACIVDHCLLGSNYVTGLFINGGAGSTVQGCIFQDNEGTALNIAGTAHTVINCFWESNCKRNDPAVDNANYRNIAVSDSQTVFIGGTVNTWPADNKWPIEVLGQEVSFINLNIYSLGVGAPGVLYLQGSFASVRLIGCRGINDKIGGTTNNIITESVPSPSFFKADLKLGTVSVSDGVSKTWCNFNGLLASPITPRSDTNTSDVIKTATGSYRINFSTSLNTNTYCVTATAGGSATNVFTSVGTKDVAYVDIYVRDNAGALTDVSEVSVLIHEITPA